MELALLADLDSAELRIVEGGAGSRNLVLEAIISLPAPASPTARFTDQARVQSRYAATTPIVTGVVTAWLPDLAWKSLPVEVYLVVATNPPGSRQFVPPKFGIPWPMLLYGALRGAPVTSVRFLVAWWNNSAVSVR